MADGLNGRLLARCGALCLVAGYVDAIGYTELGNVFAANMTGNSVLLAIAAARGQGARVMAYGVTLLSFFAGAILAAILRRTTNRAAVALLAAAVLMLLANAIGAHDPKLAILALTMGLQGGAVSRFGPVPLQTVVITGTIVRLSETIVARVAPPAAPPEPGTVRLHALAWITYGVGAALAIGAQHVMAHPLLGAAAVLLAVAADVGWEGLR